MSPFHYQLNPFCAANSIFYGLDIFIFDIDSCEKGPGQAVKGNKVESQLINF